MKKSMLNLVTIAADQRSQYTMLDDESHKIEWQALREDGSVEQLDEKVNCEYTLASGYLQARFGYAFSNNPDFTVNGNKVQMENNNQYFIPVVTLGNFRLAVEVKDHSWGDWVSGDNNQTSTCSKCDAVRTRDYAELEISSSSVDGDDRYWLSIKKIVPGTSYQTVIQENESIINNEFTKDDDYTFYGIAPKPLSEYQSLAELDEAIQSMRNPTVDEDLEVYAILLKRVNLIEVNVEQPKCGETIGVPKVTLEEGANYSVTSSAWTNVTGETYSGENKYKAQVTVKLTYGYCYRGSLTTKINKNDTTHEEDDAIVDIVTL